MYSVPGTWSIPRKCLQNKIMGETLVSSLHTNKWSGKWERVVALWDPKSPGWDMKDGWASKSRGLHLLPLSSFELWSPVSWTRETSLLSGFLSCSLPCQTMASVFFFFFLILSLIVLFPKWLPDPLRSISKYPPWACNVTYHFPYSIISVLLFLFPLTPSMHPHMLYFNPAEFLSVLSAGHSPSPIWALALFFFFFFKYLFVFVYSFGCTGS